MHIQVVEASLNSLEFELREFNTGGSPRGLSYMLGSETWWWMVCAAPVTNAIRMRQADAATFEAEEAAESAAAEEDKKAS